MSLKDRVRKAKEGRKGFKFPVGVYSARFSDWKYGKSKNGDDMFTLEFKFLSVKSIEDKKIDIDELSETIKEKGKKFEVKLLTRLDFQLDRVLEFISDAGMDLSECNEKDKKFKDVQELLTELEDLRPKVEIHVKANEDDDRYRNFYIREVEVVGTCDPEDLSGNEDGDEDDYEAPRKSSKKKQKTTEDGDTYDDLINDGWTHKQIAKHHPELID